MKTTRLSALLLSLLLLLSACGTKRQDTPDPDPAPDPAPVTPQPVEKTPDERIDDIIADMSLEEKVGQLFFVRCPETGAAEDVASYHLGGLLLFGRDYKDASGEWLTEDDFTSSLASYQAAAAIPLFIGSDEEGGTVTRAGTPTSSPRRFPPRRRSMPRSAWRECSPKRAATTKRSKPSAST